MTSKHETCSACKRAVFEDVFVFSLFLFLASHPDLVWTQQVQSQTRPFWTPFMVKFLEECAKFGLVDVLIVSSLRSGLVLNMT